MIPLVSNNLRKQVEFIFVLVVHVFNTIITKLEIFQPFRYQVISVLQPVRRRCMQLILTDIDIKFKELQLHVRVPCVIAFCCAVSYADFLVGNKLIRCFIFDKVFVRKFDNRGVFWYKHELFLRAVLEDHMANDIVPIVLPCSRLLGVPHAHHPFCPVK